MWAYDSATFGIGKLAAAAITAGPSTGYRRAVSYDTLGRPLQIATTIDGATYTMSAGYDGNGRLARVVYPSGFTARYGYTALGYAASLSDDTTGQVYWRALAMDAEQHLTSQQWGNGITSGRFFDAQTGRLNYIRTGSGDLVQNLDYVYDRLGNPTLRRDNNLGFTETFTYDALNRLTSASLSTGSAPVKSFAYNAIGNILAKSDVGTYTYPPAGSPRPHAVTSIEGATVSTTFTGACPRAGTAGPEERQRQPDLRARPQHRLDLVQQAFEHHGRLAHHQLPGRFRPPGLQAGDEVGRTRCERITSSPFAIVATVAGLRCSDFLPLDLWNTCRPLEQPSRLGRGLFDT